MVAGWFAKYASWVKALRDLEEVAREDPAKVRALHDVIEVVMERAAKVAWPLAAPASEREGPGLRGRGLFLLGGLSSHGCELAVTVCTTCHKRVTFAPAALRITVFGLAPGNSSVTMSLEPLSAFLKSNFLHSTSTDTGGSR